jgi:hypothetical protein
MNTYTKKLKFLSRNGQIDQEGNPIMEPVEKQASFYALSQTDQRQSRLFFMMRPLYREVKVIGDEKATFIADPSILYDLVVYAINVLLIVDDKFTEMDKKEFMNDSFAIMAFGEQFLHDSTPFFLNYMMNYLISQKTVKPPETNS